MRESRVWIPTSARDILQFVSLFSMIFISISSPCTKNVMLLLHIVMVPEQCTKEFFHVSWKCKPKMDLDQGWLRTFLESYFSYCKCKPKVVSAGTCGGAQFVILSEISPVCQSLQGIWQLIISGLKGREESICYTTVRTSQDMDRRLTLIFL